MSHFFTKTEFLDQRHAAGGRNVKRRTTATKRIFDLGLAILLVLPVATISAIISLCLLVFQGRPVFFVSERMGQSGRPFQFLKFRTMHMAVDIGMATGGDKYCRVTPFGGWLRARRLDELPQLWHILRGEMSFVGPRPPLRRYVELRPDLYKEVLRARPGLTGLATVIYRRHEVRLLAGTCRAEDTDEIYARRCVPKKARLDVIYHRNACLGLDLCILARTFRACFRSDRSER
ncbi:MAG: sugar transferase [Pseudomonadota bacterium]